MAIVGLVGAQLDRQRRRIGPADRRTRSTPSCGSGVKLATPAGGTGARLTFSTWSFAVGGCGGRDEQRVDRIAPAVAVGVDDERLVLVVEHVDRRSCPDRPARSAPASGPLAWLPSSWMRARRSNTCGAIALSLGMSPMRVFVAERIELPRADEPCLRVDTSEAWRRIEVGDRRDVVDRERVAERALVAELVRGAERDRRVDDAQFGRAGRIRASGQLARVEKDAVDAAARRASAAR